MRNATMSNGFVLKLTPKKVVGNAFAEVYEALKDHCFAEGAWWFGWHETNISLPRPLEGKAFEESWNAVRVFSPAAELRGQRRGNAQLVLLLNEDEKIINLAQSVKSFDVTNCEFTTKLSCRVLVGTKPDKPMKNPRALIEIKFPRELDYGIGVEKDQMFVANVQCYYDNEDRLRFVRYCSVKPEKVGKREVKPLCSSEK